MAPELSERFLDDLPESSVVLDPMMGSGSFPLAAAARGHLAMGCDSDPLAVLISQTAASDFDHEQVLNTCHAIVSAARSAKRRIAPSGDAETLAFIDFWFDPETRDKLAALADGISRAPAAVQAPLWCAFSRLIITKNSGASRARDVSHSRPHRVRDVASFDVLEKFPLSVRAVLRRSGLPGISDRDGDDRLGSFVAFRADGRRIPLVDGRVDAVMTSPPYLVAIDYLRGHRLSLVWMGYTIGYLRGLRSANIGSQRGSSATEEIERVQELAVSGALAERDIRLVNRYIMDMMQLISEIARVLRKDGLATFVIADARLKGANVSVEKIVTELCGYAGLSMADRVCREIPANRRYLPPPRQEGGSMDLRMREEIILQFSR
ncbi:hypothetical protein [Streptomyces anthocyanicus]|uniref:hypothetical protein n=1 Tax=Streptomyces anthocyanicus TaxID=68174 RepID=UPI0038646EC4|nr:hypothetical protein OH747_13340 [Streptomyces anthocyanicus]